MKVFFFTHDTTLTFILIVFF